MRLSPSIAALTFTGLQGCVNFKSDEAGAHALSYDGSPSCAQVAGFDVAPAAFTAEAWVRGQADLSYEDHPLIELPGAFALTLDPDGLAQLTDGTATRAGASSPFDWLDGELHHVAGTWDGSTSTLWIDGAQLAFNSTVTYFGASSEVLYVGCQPREDVYHEGLIDEVRISDNARYTEDFAPPSGPFEVDANTLALFHFSEGDGDETADETGQWVASLEAVEWVAFTLGGESAGE